VKVLVIGSGAIGSFYGSLLARAGCEVSVVARSDYRHIRENGIRIVSETRLGSYPFRPAAVVSDAAELAAKPDYALLCVKLVPALNRAALLTNALGPNTAIVLLSNGVEIEDEIVAAFPNHLIVSGLAFICVTRTSPGVIWHQAYGRLAIGDYPKGVSDRTEQLRAAFAKSGIDCVADPDIVTARWRKCVWNAAFNPLSVLGGGVSTSDILNVAEPLVREIMGEVCAIANALGHALPPETVTQQIESTRKMPAYKTSMLGDFEANRPMETEAILGNAVRAARHIGVPVPHLESLYALLKLREQGQPGKI
jgi:2-dehydropantoate 2-reductase